MFGLITKKKAQQRTKEAVDTINCNYRSVLAEKEAELKDALKANGVLKRSLYEKEKALAAIVLKPVHDCTKCKVKTSGNYRSCASCAANPKLVDKFEVDVKWEVNDEA